MADHFYRATTPTGDQKIFRVQVQEGDGRFRSLCDQVDDRGDPVQEASAVAPRFYGVTAAQALRRMVQVLENSYEQVEEVSLG
jgi:hypothetical protein